MNFPRIYGSLNEIPYNLFNTLRSLPYFFIGVIFGMHFKSLKIPKYLKKHWFILTVFLIPAMYPEITSITSDAKTRMWLSYEILLVMSTVFFCIVFLVPNNNVFLANRFGDFIGKISYSLYLLHMPIIILVNQLNLSIEFKLLLSFALTVLVAYISFRYFEKPIARFIRNKTLNKSIKQD
jgi:peptidoglycan/LPS O-acetylase OafA/YrhL